ncbi:MAG TPA: glycosyltransferase family 39 protein [Gemmatimonadales bacterium]|nr:glycosyltransferase family 39 protein [Gemmatimonadales bacterium]
MLDSPTRAWLALSVLVILTRIPAILHPRAIDDEQIYAVVAREMGQGGRLYLDAVERKPPLLFAVYAGILDAAGPRNWPILHLAAAAWTLATMAGLYLTLRRLFDWQTGIIAAGLYGLYQMWGDYRMLAFNGELLMNLPVVLAVLLTFGGVGRRWRWELLLAGGLIAVAALLKQPAGIAGVALAWYVLSPGYARARNLGLPHRLWHATALALGFATALGIAGTVLVHLGILRETVYWSILNHADSVGPSTWHYWDKALSNTLFFVIEALPLCLAAVAGFGPVRLRAVWKEHTSEQQALLVLLLVSILGVSVNGQFLFHYYLQLLPPLSLLGAPVLRYLLADQSAAFPRALSGRVLTGWLVLTLLVFTAVDTTGLVRNRRDSEAGLWVRAHSTDSDRLYVWGQSDRKTGMYLDADRRPATRFIASYPLTGHIFGGYPAVWGPAYEDRRVMPGAWDTLRLDFAKHPPRYIIDAEGTSSGTRYPVTRYPVLFQLLKTEYRAVATTGDGVIYQRFTRPRPPS